MTIVDDEPDPLYAALLAGYDPLDTFERLALLRPAWHRHAACRGQGTELFFPERGASTAPAKAICATCPVAGPCGGTADEHGIWAGTSARERNQARRAA